MATFILPTRLAHAVPEAVDVAAEARDGGGEPLSNAPWAAGSVRALRPQAQGPERGRRLPGSRRLFR